MKECLNFTARTTINSGFIQMNIHIIAFPFDQNIFFKIHSSLINVKQFKDRIMLDLIVSDAFFLSFSLASPNFCHKPKLGEKR